MKLVSLSAAVFLAIAPSFVGQTRCSAEEHRAEFSHLSIEAVTDREAPDAAGELKVGLLFKLEQGWHIYWKNPGDSGLPTRIDWSSSAATFSEPNFPPPLRIPYGEMMNYGYENEALIWNTVRLSTSAQQQTSPLSAKVRWALCKDECIPGNATIRVSVGEGIDAPRAGVRPELFLRQAALLSAPAEPVSAEVTTETILIRVPSNRVPSEAQKAVFVPEAPRVIVDAAAQESRRTADGSLEIVVSLKRGAVLPAPFRGLILFSESAPDSAIEVRVSAAARASSIELDSSAALMLLAAGVLFAVWSGIRLRRHRAVKEERCLQES